MPQTIGQVMTPDPLTVWEDTPVSDAARIMRDQDIGDVIVVRQDGTVCGIITDRDLTVRVLAAGQDPMSTRVQDVCNQQLESIESDAPVEKAVSLMRDLAIRRLPVVDKGHLVGIVTLGDLAVERDPRSALADISEAPPNN